MLIAADMHTHTLASTHAFSTVKEMAEGAAEKGLTAIAITDHTPGSTDAPHIWHFHNLRKAVPRNLMGVKIIYGAEASIIDYDGNIDFPHEECIALDWIIASLHKDILEPGTFEQNTTMYLKLAENNDIDVIGHCATVGCPFDYEKCLKKFKEYGKLVEINESTIVWKNTRDNYREIIKICKKYDIPVIVNTDAHFYGLVGEVSESEKLIEELDFPKTLIINADWDRLYSYIQSRHGNIFD